MARMDRGSGVIELRSDERVLVHIDSGGNITLEYDRLRGGEWVREVGRTTIMNPPDPDRGITVKRDWA